MGLINSLDRALSGEVSPMVYIMMGVNVLIGLFFVSGFDMSDSVLYETGVLVDPTLWGGVLLITSAAAIYGMTRKKESLISFGGIVGFMAWKFALISLAIGANWYVMLTIALFHLLFHAYVFLAVATDNLFRESIYRRN
jgi:hypothetical protein